jgi:hypothetical protein
MVFANLQAASPQSKLLDLFQGFPGSKIRDCLIVILDRTTMLFCMGGSRLRKKKVWGDHGKY